MTVKSALDQPFVAEIELVDVGSVSIKDVNISVADPQNFAEIGLERAAVLPLLSFKFDKNDQGKEVIKIESLERISEPYMELVVDLTWPAGQLYKAYTILLDPPGYHLTSSTIIGGKAHYKYRQPQISGPGVVDKSVVTTVSHNPVTGNDSKKKATYGPIVTNESIWQIAQRYKTSEIILPQVVLAIVGANPDGFTLGNLNGLKVGVRLAIPSTTEIAKVPADLATAEVMAHDKAWNDKQPIEHVLTPPYTLYQSVNKASLPTNSNPSTVPSIPTPNILPLIPVNGSNPLIQNPGIIKNPETGQKPRNIEQDYITKTEISLTVAAVESVREANALLMEQLRLLQKQNNRLQAQLDKRDQELKQLKSQIQVLVKQRQALPSEAHSSEASSSTNYWPLLLLLLAAGGGAGFAFWYLRNRKDNPNEPVAPSKQLMEVNSSFIKPRDEPHKEDILLDKEDPKTELMVIEPSAIVEEKQEEKIEEEKIEKKAIVDTVKEPEQIFPVTDVETIPTSSHEDESFDDISFEPDTIDEKEGLPETKNLDKEVNEEVDLDFNAFFKNASDTSIPEDNKSEPEKADEKGFLEFEPGLHHTLSPPPQEPLKKEERTRDNSINFNLGKTEIKEEPKSDDISLIQKPSKKYKKPKEEKDIEVDESLSQFFVENKDAPEEVKDESAIETELKKDRLKSKKALETLLALARTYLSMDDFDSARHSLEEVAEHGTSKQKEEATNLLDSIKGK